MKKLRPYLINGALIVLVYAVLQGLITTGVIGAYYAPIVNLVCMNIILAVSLNLVCGYLGQLALGHAGFMSVGAFSAAIFTDRVFSGVSAVPEWAQMILAMLVAAVVAGIFGILIGVPALRVKGDYLAIMTLGFGEIIRVIFVNLKITGGGRLVSARQMTSFPLVFWAAAFTILIVYTFVHSRHGRAVISIREDEIAAESSGINLTYYKVLAFVIGAALAGVAGALWSHSYSIRPENFDFNKSIDILIFVVLGGMGSITGSVLAATVLTILPEMLRDFSTYRMVVYSLLLIVMMVFRPGGLLGKFEFSLAHLIKSRPSLLRKKLPEKGDD